jgi:polyhydroxyalkanoate synthesis regulator phasin
MNIEIKINLDDVIHDMFEDESSDLTEQVKHEITRNVVRSVTEKIQLSLDKLLSEKITPQVNESINVRANAAIDDLIEKGEMTYRQNKISIVDYIKNRFEEGSGWGSPDAKIAEIAKKFGAEMKLQYNNVFAMNIVKNLAEQGLLNEDVAKALLAPPKSK